MDGRTFPSYRVPLTGGNVVQTVRPSQVSLYSAGVGKVVTGGLALNLGTEMCTYLLDIAVPWRAPISPSFQLELQWGRF